MINFCNIHIQLLDACFAFLKYKHPAKEIIVQGALVALMMA